MIKNGKIDVFKTPMAQNVQYLRKMEVQALGAYRFVMKRLIKDVVNILKSEKLAKSDDENKPRGWTTGSNRIEIDLEANVAPLMRRYFQAFNWILFGDYAGKESRKIAKDLKLERLFTPGSAISSYLYSIDANREYYKEIFGNDPGFPKDLLKSSIEAIPEGSLMYMKLQYDKMSLSMLNALQNLINDHNTNNTNKLFEELNDLPSMDKKEIKKINENLDDYIRVSKIELEMRREARKLERDFVGSTGSTIAKASATGTHQAMYEIYGLRDKDVKVILCTLEDPKTCPFCAKLSKDSKGNYIIYKLTDFRPAGYNFTRKKKDWELSIVPQHYNCRCYLNYIPESMTPEGDFLVKKD